VLRRRVDALREVAEWASGYRRFWEERYDRLEEYLEELQGRRKEDEDDGR
jgi:alkanesulfonate monooxygenase SsuD/methylene tetrahydromethanopterin reductase-like flavin-dependent oxidoreductase (luciferase family)